MVGFDTWERMESDLLGQLLDDAGSVRKAAPLLGMPRWVDLDTLAELSLMDGQPVIPELGAALFDVLADPRLGPGLRREVERVDRVRGPRGGA